jgi:hypothetical protein
MSLNNVTPGSKTPEVFNVIIEISANSDPVKYEVDKASGAIFVDRVLTTPMRYPCNYGFIPHTLAEDGDPIDALIVARTPFMPGSIARAAHGRAINPAAPARTPRRVGPCFTPPAARARGSCRRPSRRARPVP